MLDIIFEIIIRFNIGILIGYTLDYLVKHEYFGKKYKELYIRIISNTSNINYLFYVFLFVCFQLLFYIIGTYIFSNIFNTTYWEGMNTKSSISFDLDYLSDSLKNDTKHSIVGIQELNVKVPTDSSPSIIYVLINAGVIIIAIVLGFKFAHNTSTSGNKTVVVITSIVLVASASSIYIDNGGEINITKVIEIIKDNISISSFISFPTKSSGNSAIDLLNILQFFHNLELFFIVLLGYYYVILMLDWDKTSIFIEKYIPVKGQKFFKWYIKSLKLSVNFLFVSFWILLFLTLIISSHYFNFLVENMDIICKIYEGNIKK